MSNLTMTFGAGRIDWAMPPTAVLFDLDGTLADTAADLLAPFFAGDALEAALRGYATNAGGGFIDLNGREFLIRHLGKTAPADRLGGIAVGWSDGRPVYLEQVASVGFAPGLKRGDAGYNGKPAIIVSVQKQPSGDTIQLTAAIESALHELRPGLPAGVMPTGRPIFTEAQCPAHSDSFRACETSAPCR